jgi:hypothetical protein
MNNGPLAIGSNGDDRDPQTGQFTPGNAAAKGRRHPYAAHVAKLRAALLQAWGPEAIARVAEALLAAAEQGDVQAARVILAHAVGEALPADILERLEELEAAAQGVTIP